MVVWVPLAKKEKKYDHERSDDKWVPYGKEKKYDHERSNSQYWYGYHLAKNGNITMKGEMANYVIDTIWQRKEI